MISSGNNNENELSHSVKRISEATHFIKKT